MDKHTEKLMESVNEIKVSNGRIEEKIDGYAQDLYNLRKDHKETRKKVDFHDKVFGAIILMSGIFGVLLKFKIITIGQG